MNTEKQVLTLRFRQRTLVLDPVDRATIDECLHHEAFRTEQLLHRQKSAQSTALPRRKHSDSDSDPRRSV